MVVNEFVAQELQTLLVEELPYKAFNTFEVDKKKK